MDCIGEAKKFIKRAQEASHPEVINQHLAMADWYLTEAIKERGGAESEAPHKAKKGSPATGAARA
jgi:hypothetical protein